MNNKTSYSIFRWDPGSAGSLIISLSDIVRYGKTLTTENIEIIKDRLLTKVYINELGNANEYTAGAFCTCNVWEKYWLVEYMITKDDVVKTEHIPNMLANASENKLGEYHILYHGLKNDEEMILKHLMEHSGYTKHISIVGDPYKSRMLQYFKQSSRHGDLVKPFMYTCNPTINIPSGMEQHTFTYNEVFTQRSKFNEIISLLSGTDATDEIWEFAQDYYSKNQYIIDWMESNWPDVAKIYSTD